LDDLGVGYAKLKTINSDLIYSSISGFGHSGPYKYLPGYDIIGQAMGGIMSVTGWPDSPPSRTGTAIADILAGLCACIGILSSLIAVRGGCAGQKVDIALSSPR
jgi:formyl-CoA transferase